jgi:hypothetical protein
VSNDDSILASLRYLFEDIIGEEDDTPPFLPEGLPGASALVVSDGIHLLTEYQGTSYAQLYVDRVCRFVGRLGDDGRMLCDIARLMAMRMAYEDPIRIAQLKLMDLADGKPPAVEVQKIRFDELIGALPAVAGEPVLDVLDMIGWRHRRVSIRFSNASRIGIRRLKLEAALKRWRLFSIRYAEERAWVERWLHMISRALVKQPNAVPAIIDSAIMIAGHGDPYRHGLADWHAIIDGLAKPTFDGALPLDGLAGAMAEARAAAEPDRRQAALKRAIAGIRARTLGTADVVAGQSLLEMWRLVVAAATAEKEQDHQANTDNHREPGPQRQCHIAFRRDGLALDRHRGIGEVASGCQHSQEEDDEECTHAAFSGCIRDPTVAGKDGSLVPAVDSPNRRWFRASQALCAVFTTTTLLSSCWGGAASRAAFSASPAWRLR